MKKVRELLKKHYAQTFQEHGASSKGVDWKSPEAATIRHNLLLNLLDTEQDQYSVLDVGCGYGALLDIFKEKNIPVNYTGIDFVPDMIKEAQLRHSDHTFFSGDFLDWKAPQKYDYVFANGLFTQKLGASDQELEIFLKEVIKKMFAVCNKGISFNLLTDRVDFKASENFYRSPEKTFSESLALSRKCRIDHVSPFFEYFVYLYK